MTQLDCVDYKFPVDGVLNIEDYDNFLKQSRASFVEKWEQPFHTERSLSDFELLQLLGKGTFGNVILVKLKITSDFYALKAMEKEVLVKGNVIPHIRSEKKVLQSINCPMTIHMDFFFKDNCYIYMVMPYIMGYELFFHIRKNGKLDEEQAKFIAGQMVIALEYLHFLDLVHRDVKPENIMMDHTGYVKLVDFGFCKRLAKYQRTYTLCGTPEYLAPEIILNTGYGKPVDWWALGVLVYELVSGSSPFIALSNMRIYERVVANRYRMPDYFSQDLKHIISNILKADLTKRFGNLKNGTNDIKEHPWFSSIDWLALLNRKVQAPSSLKYEQDSSADSKKKKMITLKKYQEDKYSEVFQDF